MSWLFLSLIHIFFISRFSFRVDHITKTLLKPDIELTPVDDKQISEMQLLEKRFRDMIYTKGKTTDKEVETLSLIHILKTDNLIW